MKNSLDLEKEVKIFGLNVTSVPQAIIWSGIAAGILDAVAGVIVFYAYFKMNPLQVLQFISSGIHGPSAIDDGSGIPMVLAGLVYHFIIAFAIAIIYFYAYPKIGILSKHKIVSGLIYGFGIWLVLNLFVLPYSNIPKGPFDGGLAVIQIIWHMVLVGLPIALITAKHYESKR